MSAFQGGSIIFLRYLVPHEKKKGGTITKDPIFKKKTKDWKVLKQITIVEEEIEIWKLVKDTSYLNYTRKSMFYFRTFRVRTLSVRY